MLRSTQAAVTARPRARRRTRRRVASLLRRLREAEGTWLLGLAGLCILLGFGASAQMVPFSSFVIPVLIGGLTLSLPLLLWLLGVAAFSILGAAATLDFLPLRLGSVVVVLVTALVMLWSSRSRTRLGVAGTRGESMLIDLRDRLLRQGELPPMPRGWYAEAVMRSAGGGSFAGDFMVATRPGGGSVLEMVVVDVSGKGVAAGTRALLLSGAFGGLLGSVPPDQFLPAANAYLLRQEWSEGFATAVYLVVDLRTGEFELRAAGHPPAVQLHAGSGRWAVKDVEGPILGVVADADFGVARGRLQRGDALLLYTDGLVETPQRDISVGIDKLLGEAERLATRGFDRGASRLVDRIASHNDDRALVLLHRQTNG